MIFATLVHVSHLHLLILRLHVYVVIFHMKMCCKYLPLIQCSHIYNWLMVVRKKKLMKKMLAYLPTFFFGDVSENKQLFLA